MMAKSENWPISVSIGVIILGRAPENVDDAIKLADNLMYQVKKTGKNNIRIETVQDSVGN